MLHDLTARDIEKVVYQNSNYIVSVFWIIHICKCLLIMTDVFPQSTAHSVSCVPRLCVVLTESIIETFHCSLNLNSMCMENYVYTLWICQCAYVPHFWCTLWLLLLRPCWLYVYNIIACILKFAICLSILAHYRWIPYHFLSILLLDVTKFIPLVIVLKACTLWPGSICASLCWLFIATGRRSHEIHNFYHYWCTCL